MTAALQSTLSSLKERIARRDREGINRAALSLIEQQAPLGPQWAAIATLLQHHGEHDAALRALDTWQATGGPSSRIAFARATTLARAGRARQASEALDRLPPDFPDPLANAYFRGTLANDLGEREAAVRELSRAVALDPASGQSWLARTMAGPLDDEEGQALVAAQSSFAGTETADAAAYFYALGAFHDGKGEHDLAFAAFARGARTMARLQRFDPEADEALVTAEIEGWTDAALAEARRSVTPHGLPPIFVTGLPRSGTTLVEQILASHSAVAGGGEMSLFSIIGRDIGGLSFGAFQAWRSRGGDPRGLRSLYLHLARCRFPAPGRIVDKTLATSRHLGLIAALFPDAPIIWLRRDPLDCAWSAFRSYFIKGVDWSWSLRSIADFFNGEDRLFEHSTRVLGQQILVVPFDELVRDPHHWTRRINDHAGLPLEPAQLQPHRTRRPVTTNSAAQVREEIHQRGVGSAQPYERHLGAFVERYRAAAPNGG